MSYKSETLASVLSRINTSFFFPTQGEFVCNVDQITPLLESLMVDSGAEVEVTGGCGY